MTMRKTALLLLAAFVVGGCADGRFSGTAPSDRSRELLIKDDFTLEPPETITRAQLAQDLDILLYAFRNGYAGRNVIDKDEFDSALRKVEALGKIAGDSISTRLFCDQLTDILWELPDRHLGVGVAKNMEWGTAARLVKIKGSVGKNSTTNPERPWDVHAVEVSGETVPVISITGFPPHKSAEWEGFPEAYEKVLAASPRALIVDVRGNRGGDSRRGNEFADRLFGQPAPTTLKARIYSQTPATMALWVNNIKYRILLYRKYGKPVPEYLTSELESRLKNLRRAQRGELPAEKVENYDEAESSLDLEKVYPGHVVVVADRESGSSGEEMINILRPHPRMTFVGENTWGAQRYGNIGYAWLPNSQLYVAMGTDYWEFRHGLDYEKTGIPPDVRSPKGDDAMETAKRVIAAALEQ